MPSGRRFPLAFGTYTPRTGTGSQVEIVWCTCTVISALAFEDSATCPSTPGVPRPALRCVTCRTLISVFDHDRSIIFCKDRAWAQSCSRVALKILRRSLPTLPSWTRQSMASQSGTSSGPFTVTVSNLPFGWGGLISISVQRLTCPRQRLFRGPGTGPGIQPVIQQTMAWRSHSRLCWFPVGFRPPAFASWTSCSRQRIPLSSRSAYRPATRTARTLSGFPCSARMRCDRVGCLLYPGAAVSSRPAQPLRSAPAASQRPALYPAETSHRRSC